MADINDDEDDAVQEESDNEESEGGYFRLMSSFLTTKTLPIPCKRKQMAFSPSDRPSGRKMMRQSPVSTVASAQEHKCFNFMLLPTELQEYILGYLTHGELGRIRLLSQSFNQTCQSMLNKAFQKVQNSMQAKYQHIKSQMPRRESARRKHPLARECDIMETLHMRLTLLQMTFGKHIEKNHCCFFAGEILDEVQRILRYVKTTPNLGRAYKVTDELFDLSTMAMEYFKEHIEPGLPEINYFATDFPDFSSSFSTPNSRPFVLNVQDSPQPSASSSPLAGPPFLSPPPTAPIVEEQVEAPTPPSRSVQRHLRRYSTLLSILKKEVKGCRSKIAYQKKQLLEVNSKLEQHERKFEEQNKKLEALVKELRHCKSDNKLFKNSPRIHTRLRRVNVLQGYQGPQAPEQFVFTYPSAATGRAIQQPLEERCDTSKGGVTAGASEQAPESSSRSFQCSDGDSSRSEFLLHSSGSKEVSGSHQPLSE